MSDFIAKQRRDIETRLKQIDELLQSSQRLREEKATLEATLAAFGPATRGRTRPASSRKATGARRRAPRGQNRAMLLEALKDRPGATVATLSQITGISKPTTATTMGKLATSGEVTKQDLGGRSVGYSLAAREAA